MQYVTNTTLLISIKKCFVKLFFFNILYTKFFFPKFLKMVTRLLITLYKCEKIINKMIAGSQELKLKEINRVYARCMGRM